MGQLALSQPLVTYCTEISVSKQGVMLITQAGERQYPFLSLTNSSTIVEILYAASWLPFVSSNPEEFFPHA